MVVLRKRSERRTTERKCRETQTPSLKKTQGDKVSVEELVGLDSLGLNVGSEQYWSSQDRVDLQSSSILAVDTIPL